MASTTAPPRRPPVLESLAAAGHVAILCEPPGRGEDQQPDTREVSPSLEVVERLIERARRPLPLAHVDRRLELAQLAVSTCERFSGEAPSLAVTQATARALGCWADLERSRGELEAAEGHLRRAQETLSDAPDGQTSARLLSLDAALLSDRGRWEDAIEVLVEIESVARAAGDRDLVADSLIQRGVLHGWARSFEVALEVLTRADQGAIDPAVHPRHAMWARHHRIWFLLELGDVTEALELWEESQGRYRQFEHDAEIPRHRDWLEARLLYACDRIEEAQASFSLLWTDSFLVGDPVLMIRISMDLVKVYVRRGKFALGWQLISRITPLGQMWGMHRRSTEALALLSHSLGAQAATVDLVERIARYLHRAWRNPEIPFQ